MAATLLGTVGSWGIDADETGLIVESIEDTSRCEKSYVKNRIGERVGRSDYDESMEIKIAGKVTASSPWSQKVSAQLTLTNTISTGHLQAASAGRTYIDEVQRTRGNEDWKGISISAELLPFFPGGE